MRSPSPTRLMLIPALAISLATHASAQPTIDAIPLSKGMTISQVLKTPNLEREAIRTLTEVSSQGVRYTWSFVEVRAGRDTSRGEHKVFVRAADMDTAKKLHDFYKPGEIDNPGYTRYAISKSVLDRLLASGSAPYAIFGADAARAPGTNRAVWVPALYRGRLRLPSRTPEPFSLLLNGDRVLVPAYRVLSRMSNNRGHRWDTEMLILADRAHPLIVYYTRGLSVLRTVRIDQPDVAAAALERALTSECRAEVAGIYFDTNSAALSPESDRTIKTIADMLSRHKNWRVTIEGHTDSIGTAQANQLLSQNRAAAVQKRLIDAHQLPASRLRSGGHGESKPLEDNATVEGRARNRRVEIVRQC